jgi:hypothetical protein
MAFSLDAEYIHVKDFIAGWSKFGAIQLPHQARQFQPIVKPKINTAWF